MLALSRSLSDRFNGSANYMWEFSNNSLANSLFVRGSKPAKIFVNYLMKTPTHYNHEEMSK